jgi:hypothetical protein
MSFLWNPDTKEWVKAEVFGAATAKVADSDLNQLMSEILIELRKINVHLALLTGEEVNDEEID